MQGNDLEARVTPKDILVWEGLLGIIPDARIAREEARFREKRKWKQAVACYTINELLARQIWHLVWNYSFDLDLLTYLGEDFADSLRERMDREQLPFRRVFYEDPNVLARSLNFQPDIRSIYDPFPDHQFLYGAKTRIISPEQATLFGVL